MFYLQQRMQNWQQGSLILYPLLTVGLLLSWRKSSKTVLLHLGHLGSFSESITYIRQRGHPTKTMEVASGLLEYPRWLLLLLLLLSSWLSSVDTHELGGEVGDTVADRVGDSSLRSTILGGDRFNFKSSFGPLPFLPLMVLPLLFAKVCYLWKEQVVWPKEKRVGEWFRGEWQKLRHQPSDLLCWGVGA